MASPSVVTGVEETLLDAAPGLDAAEPPEARGLRRDDVRLLVSDLQRDAIEHARFHELPRFFSPGDLLVVNTSGTLNAAVMATTTAGERVELHLSTRLPGGFWTMEIRQPGEGASVPDRTDRAGTTLDLPGDGRVTVLAPYPAARSPGEPSRLWIGSIVVTGGVVSYLSRWGFPIRYGYVTNAWPPAMYQTVFAREPGSAEMPSAARPFTVELVTRLVSAGVQVAPLLLHTGVASLEAHEPPYEEFYRVPAATAARVNAARRDGYRVVAVGTTVVRALETVTDDRGVTGAGEGWTGVLVGPGRPVRSVNGLITGLHEPRATHLDLLRAVAGRFAGGSAHLVRAYAEARAGGYLWHEFGDSHLLLA